MLYKEGKFLLFQEKKPSAYGLWNLPAGKVDEGYTIEQTAVKEALEETGFKVKLIKPIATYHENKGGEHILNSFLASIKKGKLHIPEDELLDVRWFSVEEIQNMKDSLRGSWVLDSIHKAIVMLRLDLK